MTDTPPAGPRTPPTLRTVAERLAFIAEDVAERAALCDDRKLAQLATELNETLVMVQILADRTATIAGWNP